MNLCDLAVEAATSQVAVYEEPCQLALQVFHSATKSSQFSLYLIDTKFFSHSVPFLSFLRNPSGRAALGAGVMGVGLTAAKFPYP